MYCNKCGKELKDNEKFCSVCGMKVDRIVIDINDLFLKLGTVLDINDLFLKLGFVGLVFLTYKISQEDILFYRDFGANLKELLGTSIWYYLLLIGVFSYGLAVICNFIDKKVIVRKITIFGFICNMITVGCILKRLIMAYEMMELFDIITENFYFFIVVNIGVLLYSIYALKLRVLS